MSWEQPQRVTTAQALKHPNWSMGRKNIHRFSHPYEQRPRSYRGKMAVRCRCQGDRGSRSSSIHCAFSGGVSGWLGSAQLWIPDMRIPIAYALCILTDYPWTPLPSICLNAPACNSWSRIATISQLCNSPLPPSLGGGVQPAVLNAANEVAVEAFLRER